MWSQVRNTYADARRGESPLGIALAAGFAAAAVGCLLASLVSPPHEPTGRLVALVLFMAVFTTACRNLMANLLTAGIAWTMYLGFLVDREGELHWHGGIDLLRLGALLMAALVGSARWLIADLASAQPASVPGPRTELRPTVTGGSFIERHGPSMSTPDRDDRPQADQGIRRNG
jgi:hypothetical protein